MTPRTEQVVNVLDDTPVDAIEEVLRQHGPDGFTEQIAGWLARVPGALAAAAATPSEPDLRAALRKAANDWVWVLYARDQHDNEGHNLQAIEEYMVRRWLRSAAPWA